MSAAFASGVAAGLRLAGAPHRPRPPAAGAAGRTDPAAVAPRARRQGQLPRPQPADLPPAGERSEEHTSELQSLMRISVAVFCLKKKTKQTTIKQNNIRTL